MGREIKRVPVDFNHKREEPWPGYLTPPGLTDEEYDDWEHTEPPTGEGWQVWETVSEGSPVSPVFATAEELARHLSTVGDDWAVRRAARGRPEPLPTYEQALAFVQAGWAPSMVFSVATGPVGAYGEKLR